MFASTIVARGQFLALEEALKLANTQFPSSIIFFRRDFSGDTKM